MKAPELFVDSGVVVDDELNMSNLSKNSACQAHDSY